jgi:hypothetical protein
VRIGNVEIRDLKPVFCRTNDAQIEDQTTPQFVTEAIRV